MIKKYEWYIDYIDEKKDDQASIVLIIGGWDFRGTWFDNGTEARMAAEAMRLNPEWEEE